MNAQPPNLGPAGPAPTGTPVPSWAIRQSQPEPPGVAPPVAPCDFRVDLTQPDAAGHQWITLTIADGTVTATVRIPPMLGVMVGQGVAAALAQVQARWEQASRPGSKLILPNGAAGGLFVPTPNGKPQGG